MRRLLIASVLGLTFFVSAANADLLIPPCPPGVDPHDTLYARQHGCALPTPYYQTDQFFMYGIITVVAGLALLGLRRIRRSHAIT